MNSRKLKLLTMLKMLKSKNKTASHFIFIFSVFDMTSSVRFAFNFSSQKIMALSCLPVALLHLR